MVLTALLEKAEKNPFQRSRSIIHKTPDTTSLDGEPVVWSTTTVQPFNRAPTTHPARTPTSYENTCQISKSQGYFVKYHLIGLKPFGQVNILESVQ